jgi:hypothetical protein
VKLGNYHIQNVKPEEFEDINNYKERMAKKNAEALIKNYRARFATLTKREYVCYTQNFAIFWLINI